MKFAPPWRRPAAAPTPAPAAPSLPPRARGVLRELTFEERFGDVEVRAEDPGMEVAEDVLFVPDRPGGRWGVFDANDQPVRASLDFNLPWSEPMWAPPVTPVRWAEVTETLPDGDYVYFGFVHFHFGHFLVDSLSRSWPLLEGGLGGGKILFHGLGHPEIWWNEVPWLSEMLSGLGLQPTDFLHLREPVKVKRLHLPGRSWQGQTFAHQAHQRVARKIGATLLEGANVPDGGSPAYLSKTRMTGGVRRVVNERQLEAFLRPRGVEILYPETLSLREQIALFASGRTVTGTTTSAFHLSLFAPPRGRIVVIEPTEAVNSNHLIIDRLNGNTTSYQHPLGSRRLTENPPEWMNQDVLRDPVAVGRELLHLL